MQFHREFFSLLEIAIDGDGGSTMVLISRLCKLRLRVVWTIWPRSSDLVTVFFEAAGHEVESANAAN
jgi:hypothetical protein